MAITVKGVDSTWVLTEFAELMEAHSLGAPLPAAVISGGVVSVATGTRLLSVSAGKAYVPGALVEWDATTVALAANTSGNTRLDVVALQVDWSGTRLDSAGSFVGVQGTPAAGEAYVAPTLTQDAGVLYQLPLATYPLNSGETQLVGGELNRMWKSYADTGAVALDFFGGVSHGNPSLAVTRRTGVTEFGGSFSRNANIAAGAAIDLGIIVPDGFRPRRTAEVEATANRNGVPKSAVLIVDTAGGVTLQNTSGAVITGGERIRPTTTTWLTDL